MRNRIPAVVTLLLASLAAGAEQIFVPFVYVDPATGTEAFRCLVPKGWKVEGGITWSPNPALPAQSRFRFYDPKGVDELNLFPAQAFFWTNNRLFLATNPPGTLRFNTLVAQPIDLDTALTRIIASVRRGTTRMSVGAKTPVPELAALARGEPAGGLRSSAEAGKARLSYLEGDQAIEEELYAAVANFVVPMPGYFIDYWYIDSVFSFRAAKGKLASRARLFQTMIYSMRLNPSWFARVVHVKEALIAQSTEGIKAAGRFGTMIANASSNLREQDQRDWERRQRIQDTVVQNQSDSIRGVQRFTDPHSGNEVELPSGYGTAWANNLGEYIVTDSPSLNPNIGSNLHWEPMPTAR
jgi:hypothetical protein